MSRFFQSALPRRLSPVRPRLAFALNATTYRLALATLTCIAFALRLTLLHAFPLREDEAIYGYWARAATADPFFLHIWPDKPPLLIWSLTGAFALFGPSEASARLVSVFASTLTVPLVALGAWRLWHLRAAALMAALLLTFNPYAVSFGPTAYTDSLLAFFGTGAVVAALGGRGMAAGLLLAAACMTKQQGVLYAPLVVALVAGEYFNVWSPFIRLVQHQAAASFRRVCEEESPSGSPVHVHRHQRGIPPVGRNDAATSRGWAKLGWMTLGAALIILPILWWDSQRWAVAPSPWALAQRTYAPLAWLPPQQWLMRGHEWAALLWYLGGNWVVWAMLAVALAGATVLARRRFSVALLLAWGVAFVLLHVTTNLQVWDRYVLPLAPWLALVASGLATLVTHRQVPEWVRGLLLILLLGIGEAVPVGVQAARGELPLGGDHGDYAGLTDAVAWIKEQDDSAILYHQALGWHFRFYLYDELQPRGDDPPRFDLRWFPSAAYLADNAAKTAYPPKYLIVPEWATPRDLALHLALRGLTLEPRLQAGRFAVMEIVQPPRPACDWCKSSLPEAASPFILYPPTLPDAP